MDMYEAIKSGAEGYILKRSTREVVFDSISVIVAGGTLILPNIAAEMLKEFSPKPGSEKSDRHELLTRREKEVLELVAPGKPNKEIAAELHIVGAS